MASRSRLFVGSSSTSAFTPRAERSAIAARLRSPGESERPGRSTSSAPSAKVASSERASPAARSLSATKRSSRRSSPANGPGPCGNSPSTVPGSEAPLAGREREILPAAPSGSSSCRLRRGRAAPAGRRGEARGRPGRRESRRARRRLRKAARPRRRLALPEPARGAAATEPRASRPARAGRASWRAAFFTSFDFFFLRPWP